MKEKGHLTFFCGKMGVGKTTYAKKVAEERGATLLSEDDWLSTLYPDEIRNFDDYIKYSARLRHLLREHVRTLLRSGVAVVMDFPGNTEKQRGWFKELLDGGSVPHTLIYIKADDQLCLRQIAERRKESPERSRFDTEEVFHQVTGYFQPPADHEGFHVEVVEFIS